MREQLLAARIGRLDGVLITHDHADQLHGMDDLRVHDPEQRRRIDVWSDRRGLDRRDAEVRLLLRDSRRAAIIRPSSMPMKFPSPSRLSRLRARAARCRCWPSASAMAASAAWASASGRWPIRRDVDGLDEAAFAALEGVECWIVDALRHTPHPSHAHLARTLEWIARVKPRRAILTNMHVDMDYDTLMRELPPGVEPAYDGMVLTF